MSFIPFMLCESLTDPARLQDRRYIAEPKLDGQRAQLHVGEGRAVACYSRRGLDLLRHAGMAWLREMRWPFASAVLDGEAVAGDGHEGIQAVFEERNTAILLYRAISADGGGVHPPICCMSDSRLPIPQWSVILPFCTRITSTDSK